MSKQFGKQKEKEKDIAISHIDELFKLAEMRFKSDPNLAKDYVSSARKIAMKFRIHLSSEQKRRFCKKCNAFLVPSINSRVRVNNNKIIILCNGCKHLSRISIR